MFLFTRQSCGDSATPRHAEAAEESIDVSSPSTPMLRDTLRVRTDARSAFVRGTDWWLVVVTPVGLECFPALAECLAQSRLRGLDATLDALEDLRPVTFLAGCQRRCSLEFGRSLDGFTSLLFGRDTQRLVIGDSRIAVARELGEVRLSDEDRQMWCDNFLLEPEGSFFENVRRAFSGVRYRVPAGGLEPGHRRLMAPESRVLPGEEPVRLLTDGLREIFASYGHRKVALRLSGGADSRVLLVGLMDAVREGILRRDQVMCTSVLFPGFDCDESPAIRRLIDLSGFEWVGITATREQVQAAYRQSLGSPSPPFPTAFMGVLCSEEARRRGAELVLTGHGGDELFQFELTDVLARSLPWRLRSLGLIRRLRRTDGAMDELKAALSALLGRRIQRSVIACLHAHDLPTSCIQAHRLGRRMTLARGSSYENAAASAASAGLFWDVPFFRGGLLPRIDPLGGIRSRMFQDKAIAHRYLRAHAPKIAEVSCRKVPFDAAVRSLLWNPRNRDAVDANASRAYHASVGYADWQSLLEQTGWSGP